MVVICGYNKEQLMMLEFAIGKTPSNCPYERRAYADEPRVLVDNVSCTQRGGHWGRPKVNFILETFHTIKLYVILSTTNNNYRLIAKTLQRLSNREQTATLGNSRSTFYVKLSRWVMSFRIIMILAYNKQYKIIWGGQTCCWEQQL
jgi:myosin-crossreactive antigen